MYSQKMKDKIKEIWQIYHQKKKEGQKQKGISELVTRVDKIQKYEKEKDKRDNELMEEIQKKKIEEYDNKIKMQNIIQNSYHPKDQAIIEPYKVDTKEIDRSMENIFVYKLEREKILLDSQFRDETFDYINNNAIPMIGNIIEICLKKALKKDKNTPNVVETVKLKGVTNPQKKDEKVFYAYKVVELKPAK